MPRINLPVDTYDIGSRQFQYKGCDVKVEATRREYLEGGIPLIKHFLPEGHPLGHNRRTEYLVQVRVETKLYSQTYSELNASKIAADVTRFTLDYRSFVPEDAEAELDEVEDILRRNDNQISVTEQ